jgi:hypothetical protein
MKWVITALGILIAAVAITACGSASARPASQVVVQAPASTKTTAGALPPPTGIKGATGTAASGASSVSCFQAGGRAYLTSPGAGVSAVNGCTISIKPVYPLSTGQAVITVKAPDGSTGSYTASWRR